MYVHVHNVLGLMKYMYIMYHIKEGERGNGYIEYILLANNVIR